MDTEFQVEVLRLHCEHLRTLLDRVIGELTTTQHELATGGNLSFATLASHLNGLEKQSEKIVRETLRFQSFLHSLELQRTDASDATGESPPTAASAISNISQKGRCKIVCTLDGKELAVILYDKHVDLDNRTFPNVRHALPLHKYLTRRAEGMHWDAEPPTYHIVPADEESLPIAPGATSQSGLLASRLRYAAD
jgi:hypothetical protein